MNKAHVLKAIFTLVLLVCALGPIKSNTLAAGSRYFPETGKTVQDPFLAYWITHGGLTQQGFPITEASDEKNDADGKTYQTQYFERARFEYHPENNDPKFQVLLGLLGQEALTARYGETAPDTNKKVVSGSGSRTFPETGKTVTGLFLEYWTSQGGLEQQGFPITEAYEELNSADGQTYITQYFERARFEYHPESNDPKFRVLLGLVGQEIYSGKAGNPPSGTTPPPAPWAGVQIGTPVDTAFVWPLGGDALNTSAIFVKGDIATGLQLKAGQVSSSQVRLANLFPGLPTPGLTGVLAWIEGSPFYGNLFLYQRDMFSIFNFSTNRVVGAYAPNPMRPLELVPGSLYPIESLFISIGSTFRDQGPDAIALWPTNSKHPGTLFFCVTSYCEAYDSNTREELFGASGSYTTIWPGLPFEKDIDAIVPWTNGKVYFFKGDQYAVVDIATDKVEPGYPRPIN